MDDLNSAPKGEIKPIVSIIIPAYNASCYLEQTLATVFNQSFTEYEIIIVDDGSSDETETVLTPYADKIRFTRQENAGPAAARNTGLDLACGEFVQFLDADDCLLPNKLKQQVAFLRLHTDLGLVHSAWSIIDEADNHIAQIEPWVQAPELNLKTWLQRKCVKLGPMLIRRLWLESIGGFDPALHHSEDLDLILRLSLAGCKAGWLHQSTMKYREHQASTMRRNATYQAVYLPQVLDKFYSFTNLPANIREEEFHSRRFTLLWLAWHLYRSDHLDQCKPQLVEAKKYDDRNPEQIYFNWVSHFVKWSADSGWQMENFPELLGIFRQVLGFNSVKWKYLISITNWWLARHPFPSDWVFANPYVAWQLWQKAVEVSDSNVGVAESELFLSWWADVWGGYLGKDLVKMNDRLEMYADLGLEKLLQLAQLCLVVKAPQNGFTVIERFRMDLAKVSLLPTAVTPQLSALYLTYAGQSLLGGKRDVAWQGFKLALPALRYRDGRSAWKRFLASGLSYIWHGRQANSAKSLFRPRISVVIPVYNNADYILEALQSVFDQDFEDYEIIVVDDGSTDNTADTLKSVGDSVFIITQENAGSAAARNTGIAAASGEYVVLLDADDLLLPGKFAEQAAFLDNNPHVGAVHSGWRLIDKEGNFIKDMEPWHNAPILNLETWLKRKPVKMGAMLYRREWLNRIGGLDPSLLQSHDVDLMLRLTLAGCQMAWLYKPTLCYRHHQESTMRKGAEDQARYALMVLDMFYGRSDLPRKIRRRERNTRYYSTMWVSWHLFRTGNYEAAVPYLQRTRSYSPYEVERLVMDWLRHYAQWSHNDGRSVAEIRVMWPYFQQAAQLDHAAWEAVVRGLDWWLDVWWHYLQGEDGRAAQNLEQNNGCTTKELVAMVQFYLIVSPVPATLTAVNRFWSDALAQKVVNQGDKHQVTILYLTLFGQALLAKRGRVALTALASALRYSYHPRTWYAWRQFLKAGLVYFSHKPWRTDKTLVNWVPR